MLGLRLLSTLFALAALGLSGADAAHHKRAIKPSIPNGHWVDTWVSMPQLTETSNLPPAPYTQTSGVFINATIRQTLHMSVGASQIRLRISNAFGGSDLPITSVAVALPVNNTAGTGAIIPSTQQTLTFSGSPSFTVPNGALVVSDPINFTIKPQSILTVTIYLATGQSGNSITSHPGSRTTSWFAAGNQIAATNFTDASVQSAAHWYFVSAVEAWAPKTTVGFAIVGDSITDGRGSTTDQNNRWPDQLLARMQTRPTTSRISVLNQAAGGNRILADGLGPNVLSRIDRDVLSHSGVKYAMLFEGVNDIGVAAATTEAQTAIGDRLLLAYRQIAARVHAAGLPIFAATITPFSAPANASGIQPYSDPTREVTRQRVNAFIRTSGVFDAVVDFDAVLRDPKIPSQLSPQYDSGDYLHPNPAGYQALAKAFPLELFDKFAGGVAGFE